MRDAQEILSGSMAKKPTVYRLTKKNHKPALSGRYYPSIKVMPSEELIYDPTRDTNRTIRYSPGQQSIFKDEQPEKVVLGSIIFQNGSIIVPPTNPMLSKFLELSNYNEDNPNRMAGKFSKFAKLNPERDAQVAMEGEKDKVKAANQVFNMPFADLKAYARVLGVNTMNGSDMIRHDMFVLSQADPIGFLNGMDDPVKKRESIILDAHTYKIIEIAPRSISWTIGDKKSLIVPVPVGQKPSTWFSEWTLNEKDGDEVFKEIEKKMTALNS